MKALVLYPNCMMDNLIPVGVSTVIGAIKSALPDMELRLFDTTFYRTQDRPGDYERVENLQIPAFEYEDAGIRIKEGNVHEEFRRVVKDFQPDLLLVSLVESTFGQAVELLECIKGLAKPYTVAGGVFAILSPEIVLAEASIDAVCVAEGEGTVVEMCRRLARGESLRGAPGFWYKEGESVIRNPLPPLVDLDKAPFTDFSLFERERFFKPIQGRIFKMLPVEFSRGCVHRCSYCANHALEAHFKAAGRWLRWKHMDRIFAEIRRLIAEYGVEFLYFVSESFLSMPPPMFDEFCERYAEVRIPYWFNTRPEIISEKAAAKLKETNCFRIGLGIEHGNPEFRKRVLNRMASDEAIVRGCRILEEHGISYSANNIIGLPGESRDLVFDTIRLNRRIHATSIGTFVFTAFRGTVLYKRCVEKGYLDPRQPVGDLNVGSVLKNNPLSPDEIKGLLRTFPLYVKYDESEYARIAQAERFDENGNRVFEEYARRYSLEHFGKPWRRMP